MYFYGYSQYQPHALFNTLSIIIIIITIIYDYDYDYEMVLLRHTISTMYHGIIFKSCKKHNILQ